MGASEAGFDEENDSFRSRVLFIDHDESIIEKWKESLAGWDLTCDSLAFNDKGYERPLDSVLDGKTGLFVLPADVVLPENGLLRIVSEAAGDSSILFTVRGALFHYLRTFVNASKKGREFFGYVPVDRIENDGRDLGVTLMTMTNSPSHVLFVAPPIGYKNIEKTIRTYAGDIKHAHTLESAVRAARKEYYDRIIIPENLKSWAEPVGRTSLSKSAIFVYDKNGVCKF